MLTRGLLIATVVLAFPAAAIARKPPPTTNPVTVAVARAEAYWQAKPCGGKFTITEGHPPAALEGGVAQPSLEDGGAEAQAWTDVASCSITLNVNQWRHATEALNFHWFCDLVTHELGHLPPLDHLDDGQADPASIEYPLLEPGTPNFNSVPQCRRPLIARR
jgi:hypothetical protein